MHSPAAAEARIERPITTRNRPSAALAPTMTTMAGVNAARITVKPLSGSGAIQRTLEPLTEIAAGINSNSAPATT